MSDYNSLLDSPELTITFLTKHSAPFVKITKPRSKTGRKNHMKLPAYVKVARAEGISTYNSWKQSGFPTDDTHVTYLAKRREYRQKLRKFLNQVKLTELKIYVMLQIQVACLKKLVHWHESPRALFWFTI